VPQSPDAIAIEPANEPGELLILWESEVKADRGIKEIADRFRVGAVERIALPSLGRVLVVYRLASIVAAADLKTRITLSHSDWIVDYNSRYALLGEPRLYATGKIGLMRGATSARPVRIGLLDTAVAPIPALHGATIAQRNFVSGGEAASPAHGTSIAALLLGDDRSAGFIGIARGCALSVAQVMRAGTLDTTNVKLLFRGADWLVGARVELINASLGGPPNRLLHELTQLLSQHRIALIAAAGNSGPDAPPIYPAAYESVLAVTATDALDRVYPKANHGHYIDLSAPGVDLWVPGETSGHYVTGTSFAAALVTGAVALQLSTHSASDITAVLRSTLCANARDLGTAGRDPVFGCGLLQLPSDVVGGDL